MIDIINVIFSAKLPKFSNSISVYGLLVYILRFYLNTKIDKIWYNVYNKTLSGF